MPKQCPHCGHNNTSLAKICKYCRKPMDRTNAERLLDDDNMPLFMDSDNMDYNDTPGDETLDVFGGGDTGGGGASGDWDIDLDTGD